MTARPICAAAAAWLPLVLAAAFPAPAARALEPWQTAAGYDRLLTYAGAATPLGDGVSISMVEAPDSSGRYMPDLSLAEFTGGTDPSQMPVTPANQSGNSGVSQHATSTVGRWFFGNTSGLAKAANHVTVFEANDWLGRIRSFVPPVDPETIDPLEFQVQNHSWVGAYASNADNLDALKHLESLVETTDMTLVVGTNNNGDPNNPLAPPSLTSAHPKLLSHAFNVIAVGRTDGYHSRGATSSFYFGGRTRPDIVSSAGVTSAATAQVSSAATILASGAAALEASVDRADAVRNEVLKATLLAGATKQEFASFVDPATGLANAWDQTPTRPLDDLFGAGEVNVYYNHRIQRGGRNAGDASALAGSAPTNFAGDYGWDYQDLKLQGGVGDVYYNLVVDADETATELSVVLSWNAGSNSTSLTGFAPETVLQNLDLRLYDSTAGLLAGGVVAESVSTVDNVEHLYLKNLNPGVYTLAVSGAAGWDFGLAWRMNAGSADFNADGVVNGVDLLTWQRNLGAGGAELHAAGDANRDGVVDTDDLALVTAQFRPTAAPQAPVSTGVGGQAAGSPTQRPVPEPSAALLAAVAGLLQATRRRKPAEFGVAFRAGLLAPR